MSAFDWYGYGPSLSASLVAAGLPEELGEWDIKDREESGGKHDCTDFNGFAEDPDEPGTGYYVGGTQSYNDGLQSFYIGDTRKMRRVLVEKVLTVPDYEVIE